jgi:hypothetical protein
MYFISSNTHHHLVIPIKLQIFSFSFNYVKGGNCTLLYFKYECQMNANKYSGSTSSSSWRNVMTLLKHAHHFIRVAND